MTQQGQQGSERIQRKRLSGCWCEECCLRRVYMALKAVRNVLLTRRSQILTQISITIKQKQWVLVVFLEQIITDLDFPQLSADTVWVFSRAQDLTGGHSGSVQTLSLVLASLLSTALSGPWTECRQMKLEASDRSTGEFMGPLGEAVGWWCLMGSWCLRQKKKKKNRLRLFQQSELHCTAGIFTCQRTENFYLCVIRRECSGNYHITLPRL